MEKQEERKCALVGGGSSGMGQAVAIRLAEEGYDIAFTYAPSFDKRMNNESEAEKTIKQIEALGRRCFGYVADFAEDDAPKKAVDQLYKDLGRLDVLVSATGLDGRESILTVTPEHQIRTIKVNYASHMLLAGAVARYMIKDGIKGNIVFISSTRAKRSYPDDYLYGSTKAAIERACESIALDLSPYGIRVNCIAPGATASHPSEIHRKLEKGIPLKRLNSPREIADVILFLISEQAKNITGFSLRVDGGLVLPGLPEGWTEAQFIDPAWIKKNYDAVMKDYFEN